MRARSWVECVGEAFAACGVAPMRILRWEYWRFGAVCWWEVWLGVGVGTGGERVALS